MSDKENVLETQPVETPVETPVEEVETTNPVSNGPTKWQKFQAKAKEWFRKKIVNLKRRPQNIALVVLVITTIFFMLSLFVISQAVNKAFDDPNTKATGICTFVTTLLSLLVLVSFLNAFPKRKKPNIFFIVLVFVMIAAMVACDVVYYVQMGNCLLTVEGGESSEMYILVKAAQPNIIGHLVLLGLSAVVFALLPVYKKLINKINTKVELESATETMHGGIDIQED